MAVELLRCQVQHLDAEQAARRRGKHGPVTLSMKREAYHDLEALLWVLVYAMMIHHYNSLAHEGDRKDYKSMIDHHFGHGSAETIIEKRQAMYMAHSRIGQNRVSQWFPDPHEQRFFIRCMALIADHDRGDEEKEDLGTLEGEITPRTLLWDNSDNEDDSSPDEDAEDASGTYGTGKDSKGFQKSVAGLRKRPPVITYESVALVLKKSIGDLQ